MTLKIDPERLKEIRKRRGLTQDALAKKARLDKGTISRMEREKRPIRKANLDRLAQALGVDPEVLTGEKPIPEDIGQPKSHEAEASYQLNVRLQPAVRNAYELAARQYGVSVQKIAQLAPLLFVILAEASFKHLTKKVEEYWEKREQFDAVDSQLPHSEDWIYFEDRDSFVRDLEDSIARRDLFNRRIWRTVPDDWDSDNPFAAYLKALTEGREDIAVNAVGPTSADYRVCRAEAMGLVENDQNAAERLLSGQVAIDRIFRGLKTAEERIKWICENQIPESKMEGQIQEESPKESWAANEILTLQL